ncbi:unnamed protein product [Candidula unifasciata]|uniref:N-acetylgalactosaminide beta-1,3-galactosyltransferase n=1 Tax=Candidula unifasciata TaxID=100452 RepID=A0A8S3ZR50_9EUPU|nr:unnamed protein product [Candidula unifasciata]
MSEYFERCGKMTMVANNRRQFVKGFSIGVVLTFIALTCNSYYGNQFIQWTTTRHSNLENGCNHGPAASFRRTEDSNAFSDDNSTADKLREQVRVLVAIMTALKNIETRAQAVKDTWAKHCSEIIYFSTGENKKFPTVRLNVPEGMNHLTPKTMGGFDYMYDHYFNDFDWFMKADDDTYVIMENLRYFLSSQNFSQPVSFGQHFVLYDGQEYQDGGAGYVLSKESLRRFRHRGNNSKCVKDGAYEDVEMAHCLESLGVQIVNSKDSQGRSRFHTFVPSVHIHGTYPKFYNHHNRGDNKGIDSMSDYAVSFHRVTPSMMWELEFYVYHLRPYGICNVKENLELKNNKSSSN